MRLSPSAYCEAARDASPSGLKRRLAAKLIDALRNGHHVLLLLLGVLCKLGLDPLACDTGRGDGVASCSAARRRFLWRGAVRKLRDNRALDVAAVGLRDDALGQVLAGSVPQCQDVGQKRLRGRACAGGRCCS